MSTASTSVGWCHAGGQEGLVLSHGSTSRRLPAGERNRQVPCPSHVMPREEGAMRKVYSPLTTRALPSGEPGAMVGLRSGIITPARGGPMNSNEEAPGLAGSPAFASRMSRRRFGQAVGAAVMSRTLQADGFADTSTETMPQTPQAHARGDDLCYLEATQLAAMIRGKQVSAREVMTAHLAQ